MKVCKDAVLPLPHQTCVSSVVLVLPASGGFESLPCPRREQQRQRCGRTFALRLPDTHCRSQGEGPGNHWRKARWAICRSIADSTHHRRRHREEGTSRKSAGLAAFLSAESRSEKHDTQPLSGPANPPTRGPSQEGKKPRRGAETAKGDLTTGSTLSFLCRCFDALRVQSCEEL